MYFKKIRKTWDAHDAFCTSVLLQSICIKSRLIILTQEPPSIPQPNYHNSIRYLQRLGEKYASTSASAINKTQHAIVMPRDKERKEEPGQKQRLRASNTKRYCTVRGPLSKKCIPSKSHSTLGTESLILSASLSIPSNRNHKLASR